MGKEEEVRNRKERKENASSHARQWDLVDCFSVYGLVLYSYRYRYYDGRASKSAWWSVTWSSR